MNDPGSEYGFRSWWTIVQRAVRSEGVVFHSPPLDEYLGLSEGVEDLLIQQFVSQFTVETFTVAVFPGAARFNVEGPHACICKPLANSRGGEFRSVIRSDVFRRTMGHEEIREAMEHVIGVELSLHHDVEALPTEFVDDGQDLDRTAVVGAVCHKIVGPDVVAMSGPEPDTRPIVEPQTSAFGLLLGNLQPLLTPDAFHPLMIDPPTFLLEQCCNPAITVASIPFGKFNNLFSELLFYPCPVGYEPLG